ESLRSEKLESIGVLAGGIAHDFNNLLGIVIGNLEMAERVLDSNVKARTYISAATKASRRAAELTQQLLTFSKGGDPIKKLSDLKEVVRESAEFVLHGTSVVLSFESSCDEALVAEIDSGQIGQVVQNIIINARQAMGDGGRITVSARNCENCQDLKRCVHLSIRDDGPGIAPDILDKIFDPYFTTKEKGSGLGLAICHSVIKKHGGILSVVSELEAGTEFTIKLPVSEVGKTKAVAPAKRATVAAQKNFKILIMDDEEMIRELATEMLSFIGHQVTTVRDGQEAVENYRNAMDSEKPFDLVILDLTVPGGMGGKEAAELLLQLDPKARIIVSSGYSNDPVMAEYEQYGFVATISKPYDVNGLERILENALHSSGTNSS
ncbi:MAG: ATP-binding protein, partial [Desulfobulbaceae bacterium]|nr:ATP-binding protein [Desulfobulbaceae bacterium]